MQTLWQDLRYALRTLQKNPGFAAVAIITLALGIGANTAIFSFVNAVLLRPLPFTDPDRIVNIWETDPNRGVVRGIASPAEFLDWKEQNHVFEQIAAWRTWFYDLGGKDEPEQVWGVYASPNFFELLEVKAALGRTFIPEEGTPGHEHVVVLSHGIWQRHFGGDPAIVGQSVTIDSQPFTVVGVMPAGFSLYGTSRQYDIWMPFAWNRAQLHRDDHSVIVFGRLKTSVTLQQAQAEMLTIVQRLQREYPTLDQGLGLRVVTMHDDVTRTLQQPLKILLAAVALVLLIACANVANLLLARAAGRQREIAARAVLGAGRWRLVRQLLTESAVFGLLGGLLGILLSLAGMKLLLALLPPTGGYGEVPHKEWIGINGPVLGFTLLLSLFTGMLFGLVPAIQISRTDLSESLKEGGKGSTARHNRLARSLVIVSELALSLVLLVCAGLLLRSFARLLAEDPGFKPAGVLTAQVWLPPLRYPDPQKVSAFFSQTLENVSALPGVQSATAINFLPLSGWQDQIDFAIEGRPAPPPGQEFTSQYRVTAPSYFETMGIPLRAGRVLASNDGADAPAAVVINQELAQHYWTGQNPVGRRIRIDFGDSKSPWRPAARKDWATIVGVVGDVREWQWGEQKIGELYVSSLQNPSHLMSLAVRTGSDPVALVPALRQAVFAVDRGQPLTSIKTMDQLLSEAVAQRRLNATLLACFAALALVMAAVGIYGVMAYSVAQRTHEIGIRMAVGAQPRDVLQLIVMHGMRLVLIGVAIGVAASLWAARLLSSFLYGVHASDPLTFAAVALLLIAVAFAACYIPARRAMRVDPMDALRYVE